MIYFCRRRLQPGSGTAKTLSTLIVIFIGLSGSLCTMWANAAQIKLQATVYYVALEADYPAGKDATFRSKEARVLHRSSAEYLRAATTEGTARLKNGTVLNIITRSGEPRWTTTSKPFGLSSTGCALVPYYSAAVDPRVIPLGSKLFIPATVGMGLADGRTHNGVWKAVDTGPGISGKRIDLFTGDGVATALRFEDSLRARVGKTDRLMLEVKWSNSVVNQDPCG